jgi:integrase
MPSTPRNSVRSAGLDADAQPCDQGTMETTGRREDSTAPSQGGDTGSNLVGACQRTKVPGAAYSSLLAESLWVCWRLWSARTGNTPAAPPACQSACQSTLAGRRLTRAPLAQLIVAVEEGRAPATRAPRITGLELDDLYSTLENDVGLSPAVVARCHSQVRAVFSWALRKKLVAANPALSADPPRLKPAKLHIPSMDDVRAVQAVAPAGFAAYLQLAATVGARRGTLVALRWGDLDLEAGSATFTPAIAESGDGVVEKGTKADRPYVSSLGPSMVSALQSHRQRAIEQALRIGVPFGAESFVFSDDGGLTHWNLSWPSHAWKRYSAKAGVKPTRLHDGVLGDL